MKELFSDSTKLGSSDVCRFCGVNFKISVGDFCGNNKYILTENLFKIPERARVDIILLADLLKIHLGVESTGLKIFP